MTGKRAERLAMCMQQLEENRQRLAEESRDLVREYYPSREETGLRMFLEARAHLYPEIPILLDEYDGLAAPIESVTEGGT